MSAPDYASGLADLAGQISFSVAAWHEFGYETPPAPECKAVPPLGERSAEAVTAGHAAIAEIDQLTRQLCRLREQLVGELRQDSDLRAARVDAMLARRRREREPETARWRCGYCETEFDATPSSTPVTCPLCGPLHGPGAPCAQPVQLRIPGPLPWHLAGDSSHWRAQLPDGRTAVIRRVLGPGGEASLLYVPALYESATDFVTGPECNGVLAAAQWVAEHGAVTR